MIWGKNKGSTYFGNASKDSNDRKWVLYRSNLLNHLENLGGGGFDLVAQTGEGVRRVDVDEDAVAVHLDLADDLGMLADQVLGADIARQLGHLGDEALRP